MDGANEAVALWKEKQAAALSDWGPVELRECFQRASGRRRCEFLRNAGWDPRRPVEISETCPAGVFAEPGKRQSDVPRQAEGHEVFLSAGGGCVCPVFLCCTYRQGLNRRFTVTTTFSSTKSASDPKDALFAHLFFLYFNQGPQRHRKESDSCGASGDSRAQQTSHDRFNEGGTSFQSQGGSREHWVQAPAVGRHTRII